MRFGFPAGRSSPVHSVDLLAYDFRMCLKDDKSCSLQLAFDKCNLFVCLFPSMKFWDPFFLSVTTVISQKLCSSSAQVMAVSIIVRLQKSRRQGIEWAHWPVICTFVNENKEPERKISRNDFWKGGQGGRIENKD